MEVKTNKEYQAMQKEIAAAEREVRSYEDRILERMEEGEALGREVKAAEAALAEERRRIEAEGRALDDEGAALEAELTRLAAEREALRGAVAAEALRLFDRLLQAGRGVAVVEARDGHCGACHVRLRPQVFNDVRRNDALIQCDHCKRLLYFQPGASPA
jgi:predicted  nucleic acid-binding Zn-ribbon protein